MRLCSLQSIVLGAALLCVVPSVQAQDDVKIIPDVVYGHKDGLALTVDILQPAKPNGAAVLAIQSGGWYSGWQDPKLKVGASQPLLSKGFTVIFVYHGSAPRYAIPDAVSDVRRAVRFVRMHAKEYGIDPERLGVWGGSAGGHLSLVLGTTGDDGDPKSPDEVLRHSSKVAAVVALYPPTDLREWVKNPPEVIRKIAALKPPLTFDSAKAPEFSPVLHAAETNPPILMIHGDKDELVPLEHSRNLLAAMEKVKAPGELLVIEGAAHGFNSEQNLRVVPALSGWFEKHLAKK